MKCEGKKKVVKHKLQLATNSLLIDMSGWTESLLRKGKRETKPGAPSSASERLSWPFTNTHLQTGLPQAYISKMREAALSCSRHLPQEQEQRAIPSLVLNGHHYILLSSSSIFISTHITEVITSLQSTEVTLPWPSRQHYVQMTKRLGEKNPQVI